MFELQGFELSKGGDANVKGKKVFVRIGESPELTGVRIMERLLYL